MSKLFRVLKKKLGLKKEHQKGDKSGKANALSMGEFRATGSSEQMSTDTDGTQLDSGVGSMSLSNAGHSDADASFEDQGKQTGNPSMETQIEPGPFRCPYSPVAAPVKCPTDPIPTPSPPGSETPGPSVSERFPASAANTPIGALRKSRERLALWLNIEQMAVDRDLTPDYMGLAELLGFEAVEIQNFWERNPTHSLFVEWIRAPEKQPYLWKLVECLNQLGRQDILDECQGLILEDVRSHIAEIQLLEHYTVGRLSNFDCYVNIADEDLMTIGREIIDTLEGVYRLRLCLTLRDVTLGGFEFENMATMLETRCNSKVVIILSKYYEQSDACQFLTQFAVTLDPGARRNKLIPVLVDEDVFIPRVLRCLATLNYHRDRKLGFLWPRLYAAIKQQ